MATSTLIKGRYAILTLKLAAGAAVPFQDDSTSIVLDNEEGDTDVQTFFDAQAGGGRQWFFTISAVQSLAAGSLHAFLWANAGAAVTYDYGPAGNAAASVAQPHFTGTAVLPSKPRIGGDAGAKTTYTFDIRIDCDAEPLKVTAEARDPTRRRRHSWPARCSSAREVRSNVGRRSSVRRRRQ